MQISLVLQRDQIYCSVGAVCLPHQCKPVFLPDRGSVVSGCSLPPRPLPCYTWLMSLWPEWQGRASSHSLQACVQLMRKTRDSKSLRASGPAREGYNLLCFNSTTPEHQTWFTVGKSPFWWWMGAGPSVSPDQAVGWELQPCRSTHLQLFSPHKQWA